MDVCWGIRDRLPASAGLLTVSLEVIVLSQINQQPIGNSEDAYDLKVMGFSMPFINLDQVKQPLDVSKKDQLPRLLYSKGLVMMMMMMMISFF